MLLLSLVVTYRSIMGGGGDIKIDLTINREKHKQLVHWIHRILQVSCRVVLFKRIVFLSFCIFGLLVVDPNKHNIRSL